MIDPQAAETGERSRSPDDEEQARADDEDTQMDDEGARVELEDPLEGV